MRRRLGFMSPPHFTFCISPNIIILHPYTLFCITPILPISCSSRPLTCNHRRPFLSCSQQTFHNYTHELELSVPTHRETKRASIVRKLERNISIIHRLSGPRSVARSSDEQDHCQYASSIPIDERACTPLRHILLTTLRLSLRLAYARML